MKSLEELRVIRERMQGTVAYRSEHESLEEAAASEHGKYRTHVLVCGGTGCTSSGSQKIRERLDEEIRKNGLEEEVCVIKTGCFGLCALGPIMIVYPEGAFYSMVKEEDIPEIVEEHLAKGNVVKRLLYDETVKGEDVLPLQETNFYKKQHRVALRNCGVISPENIDEYIGTRGYEALGKVLTEMTPAEVIQVMLDSGLRGRGGAGFPTGMKWKFAAANEADQKYVCCNADEGDPGAFMDRSVLEGDPHVVLEAMAIAGYAIGASQGYIYVRAEYPIAVERLEIAIGQAREYGLLGKNGAGKTTLLKLIGGLLFPLRGRIEVCDAIPRLRKPSFLSDIFFIPEEICLPDMKMKDYFPLICRFYPKFDEELLFHAMEIFEVSESDKMGQMSYGQRKKALISLGIACNTRLLMMDEPTNGLDIPSKSQFRRLIASVASEERCVVISTHQVRDLENLIDALVIIEKSRILVNTTVEQITDHFVFRQLREGETALFAEESLRGRWGMVPNLQQEDSKLDMELFFNAVLEHPAEIEKVLK